MLKLISRFIKNNRLFLVAGFLLWILGLIGIFLISEIEFLNLQRSQIDFDIKKIEKSSHFRFLDGVSVESGQENNFVKAVMIDNSAEGRGGQSGLEQAGLIYETLVEGGRTRWMALFSGEQVDKIGPVRSARPYFLPLVQEFGALYAHIGGSQQALNQIKEDKINDLDEYYWYNTEYFWRDKNLPSPYNLFTKTGFLNKAIGDLELDKLAPIYQPWKFKDDNNFNSNLQQDNIQPLIISWSSIQDYQVEFLYNAEKNSYQRYLNPDAKKLQAENIKNIVVQKIERAVVLDEIGRLALKVTGQGEAIIFQDGGKIIGSWKKLDDSSRTIFYDSQGQEVLFNRGQTWVEIVPNNIKIIY